MKHVLYSNTLLIKIFNLKRQVNKCKKNKWSCPKLVSNSHSTIKMKVILFKAYYLLQFSLGTGRPTRTGRAAPVAGPALGPTAGLGPGPAVVGVWPGMFRRLNLGTTATLTLRLGRACRGPRETNHRTCSKDKSKNEIMMNNQIVLDIYTYWE